MATTVTLTRSENVFGFFYGGSCNLPEIDIINTDTNIVNTIKYDDKYLVFKPYFTIKNYLSNVKTSVNRFTNSELKAIRYTMTLTPENYPDTREVKFKTDLQIVYDWENETGEKVFSFTTQGALLAYALFSSATTTLKNNCYQPGITLTRKASTDYNTIDIYLNIKQTFTTTAAQNIKVKLMLREGFEGILTIPVVRTV